MADYPGGVYSPRTKENKPGISYDAAKTTIGFAEDITKLDDEVVAIETDLVAKIDQDVRINSYPQFSGINLYLGSGNNLQLVGQGGATTTLALDTNYENRTLTISGNPTLADWFNQNVKTSAAPTFTGMLINLPSQNYLLTHRGNYFFALQGQSSGIQSSYEYFSKDGNGLYNINMILWAKGLPGSVANREFLQYGCLAANNQFEIKTGHGGTGSARPLNIFSSGNINQLFLKTDGNIGIGIATPTAKLDINSNILRLRTAKTPASAGAAGNAGDICWDTNYIYICVATNTWKRAAIAAW